MYSENERYETTTQRTEMTNARIAVLGTGANGASIGADMVRAGLDVTFIEQWPAHVEAMRANGLTVHLPTETQVTPITAYHLCQVAELRKPFDIVFTSVKTYDTRWVTELIKPLLHDDSIVVGLQNGMTIDAVADVVGEKRSVGAVLGIAANMFEPGVVTRQYGPSETWLAVGSLDGTVTPGKRVLVIAQDDHMPPLAVADFLATAGHDVTVVYATNGPAPLLSRYSIGGILARLDNAGVKLRCTEIVTAITDDGVQVRHAYSGRAEQISDIDSVVLACGGVPEASLYEELKGQHSRVHLLGDAFAPRRLLFATKQAYALASLLDD
jgi:predicted dinucleotide-binding enzyme